MAAMLSNTYATLLEAGASPETAQKAAEEIAVYDNRSADLFVKLERLNGRVTLLTTQLGLLLAGVSALLLKAFA